MTDNTLVLSPENQQHITTRADEIGASSAKKGWRSLGYAVTGLATAAVLMTVFPPGGLAYLGGIVAGAIGFLTGTSAVANLVNASSMKGVKDDAKQEGFVSRMKERAERFGKLHKLADRVSGLGVVGMLAAIAVGAMFPPLAPVTAVLHTASLWTWVGVGAVRNALKPSLDSATELNRTAEVHAPKDSLEAILKPSNESTLAKGAGPSNAFGVAVAPANDTKSEHKSRWKQALGL